MKSLVSFLAVTTALGIALAPRAARAQAASAEPEQKKFESSAGAKLLLGGSLYSKPSNTPPGYDGIGFVGDGGGFGYGFAAYYEARFVQHLGLEADLGYDHTTIQRNITVNGVTKVTEKFSYGSTRLSFIAKGIASAPFGRLWLGLGPEFVFSGTPDASLEITSGPGALGGTLSAEKKNSTNLLLAMGMAIHIGDNFEIPIDIRAAKNLSQDSSWTDRVKVSGTNYSVVAQSTWDFRLAVGAGYRF